MVPTLHGFPRVRFTVGFSVTVVTALFRVHRPYTCVYSNFYDRGNLLTNLFPPPGPGIHASRRFNFGNPPQLYLSRARARSPALRQVCVYCNDALGGKDFGGRPPVFF